MERVYPFFKRNVVDIVFFLIYSIAALAVFIMQISSSENGKLNDALFSGLEFLLSLASGWVLQRIVSREEFQKSLKQYAQSAFRRINDISKSITRLERRIIRLRSSHPMDQVHELDVIRASVEELGDTVKSSIYDWTDIIEDDLKKINQIQDLEEEIRELRQNEISSNYHQSDVYERLNNEIKILRSELPLMLNPSTPVEDALPREGRYSELVHAHFMDSILTQSAIFLSFGLLDPNIEDIDTLTPFHYSFGTNMFTDYFFIHGNNGERLGKLKNSFHEIGVYGNDFIVTLLKLLPSENNIVDGRETRFDLPGSTVIFISPIQGYFVIKVPISSYSLEGAISPDDTKHT